MGKIVRISWINPSRNISQHSEALEGIEITHKIGRPTDDYLFISTSEKAQKLKTQIEQLIPQRSYAVIDVDNKPLIHGGQPVLATEPQVDIIDIP